jgi:hypothetical protein
MEIIKMNHDAGFFSVCNINLRTAIGYYSSNKKFCYLDAESQWNWYKDEEGNIYNKFFEFQNTEFDLEIKNFTESSDEDQFSDYSLINYSFVSPFVKKYFHPSLEVISIKNELISKYNLDLSNTISLCYRGNDKERETNLPTYNEMESKLSEVISKYPNHKILIQSDEIEFYEHFKEKYNNLIIIDEIFKINKNPHTSSQYNIPSGQKIKNAQTFLAIMLIMSESNVVVLNSGNVGLWVCLYRENNNNVYQYLSPKNSDQKNWFVS